MHFQPNFSTTFAAKSPAFPACGKRHYVATMSPSASPLRLPQAVHDVGNYLFDFFIHLFTRLQHYKTREHQALVVLFFLELTLMLTQGGGNAETGIAVLKSFGKTLAICGKISL